MLPNRVQKKQIEDMDFKELRAEVQELSDALAMMQRRYEDILYNLDEDNLGVSLTRKGKNMQTAITQTEKEITLQAEKVEGAVAQIGQLSVKADEISARVTETEEGVAENSAAITINADKITSEVTARQNGDTVLETKITQTASEISAIVEGDYTGDILSGYLTGIEITPNNIKMIDGNEYSIFNSDGLRFYDAGGQVEGWAIEPADTGIGGALRYYINNGKKCEFGRNQSGTGYTTTDLVLKATDDMGRFVVDVTASGNSEVKFLVRERASDGAPYIYANEKLLATQDWVLENAGGSGTAVFA